MEICFVILLLFELLWTTVGTEDNNSVATNVTSLLEPLPLEVSSYLSQFGYLPPPDPHSGNLRSESAVRLAISRLQKFAGLQPTGQVDTKTAKLLKTKRCGLPDYQYEEDALESSSEFTAEKANESGDGPDENWLFLQRMRRNIRRRLKRYIVQGSVWDHKEITYKIENHTPDLGPWKVRRAVFEALKLWSDASALTFVETDDDSADIKVRFERGNHGDGYPFDGPNIVLAHAFFPGKHRGGDVHFDEDEQWSDSTVATYDTAVNLLSVAAHEFGHSLGLSHSNVQGSLMYPYYQLPVKKLPYDDTVGIQQLYGRGDAPPPTKPPYVPTTTPTTTPRTVSSTEGHTTTNGPPTACDSDLDAVSRIRNEIFVFKGRYFWRFDEKGYLIEKPFPIELFWNGFPENLTRVDAFYEIKERDEITFFSGRNYWIFEANHIKPGYPKDISELGLPKSVEKVDGAFVWDFNMITYLFSGDEYWRFDESVRRVDLDYPRNIRSWKGLPYNIDAVFTDHNEKTYFFKNDKVYQFSGKYMRVERGYPIPIKKLWRHCSGNSDIRFASYTSLAEKIQLNPTLFVVLLYSIFC